MEKEGNNFVLPLFVSIRIPEDTSVEKSNTLIFWTGWFDLAYYTGVSPFRFEWNVGTESWDLLTTNLRKNLIGTVTVFCILNQCFVIAPYGKDYGNPTDPTFYFILSGAIVEVIYISIFYIIWTKQTLIQSIFVKVQAIEVCSHNKSFKENAYLRKKETWIKILGAVFLLQTHVYVLTFFSECEYNIYKYYGVYRGFTLRAFGLNESASEVILVPLTILIILLEMYFINAEYILQLHFFYTTLFLRSLVMKYIREIKDSTTPVQGILEGYRGLKQVTDQINAVCGPVTFCVIASALVYLCQMLIGITTTTNRLHFIRTICFVLYFSFMIYVAADTHKQTGEIYKWLYNRRNYKRFSQFELLALLHDLERNDIGMAVDSCFVVNFNFMGVMLGLITSYTLIFYQLQALSKNPVDLNL